MASIDSPEREAVRTLCGPEEDSPERIIMYGDLVGLKRTALRE